jgi:hypothetical protein
MAYARIVLSFSTCSSPSHDMLDYRVHTEWQWQLSCVHSITMVKSAQSDEGGGALPSLSLYLSSRAKLWCMLLQLRGQIHSPYFSATSLCTLWLDSPNSLYSTYKSDITINHATALFPLTDNTITKGQSPTSTPHISSSLCTVNLWS